MLEIRNQLLVWVIETKDLWRQETCSCTMQMPTNVFTNLEPEM